MENNIRESRPARSASTNWIVGLALIFMGGIFLAAQYVNASDMIWSVALIGAGLTFGVVFATAPRQRWWALIPGYILAATGAFILVEPLLRGEWDAIYWIVGVGVPFLVVFLTNPRERWWALIPAGIMAAVAGFLVVEPILPGEMDAVYWMAVLGIPFFIVFATNPRERWWALIPTYVFATVGTFLLIEPLLSGPGDLVVTYWTWAIAAPFLFVFLTKPSERWWALIPGGIFAAIGLGFFVASAAIIVPIALIGGGILLLALNMTSRRKLLEQVEAPRTGPEADHAPDFEPIGAAESGPDADHA